MGIKLSRGSVSTVTFSSPQEIIINHADDSIRIGDGTRLAEVTTNKELKVHVGNLEPIPVTFESGELKIIYSESNSIASGIETNISTYTIPAGKTGFLQRVEVSGNNVAIYRLKVDGSTLSKRFTSYTKFNEVFEISSATLATGSIIEVTVEHSRPHVGDFSATIQVKEL